MNNAGFHAFNLRAILRLVKDTSFSQRRADLNQMTLLAKWVMAREAHRKGLIQSVITDKVQRQFEGVPIGHEHYLRENGRLH